MKILVTGAAGCLGRQLVESLLSSGHRVLATDIKSSPFLENDNLVYKQLDIVQDEIVNWIEQQKPQAIVHLASILQISKRLPRERAYQIDVIGTQRILEAASKAGCKKFVTTTSGAAYGYHKQNIDSTITEDWPALGNDDYFYAAHKAAVEKLLNEYRHSNPNMAQVTFRPGAIIGPDFDGPVVNLFNQKVIVGLMSYPGPFNFIWSSDVVAYIQEAIETEVTGTYNIAGDGALSLKEIAATINKPYLALPAILVQSVLTILKPLGLSQYGPEQVKFVKYRPVLSNSLLKSTFKHQPKYSSKQALQAFIEYIK